MLQALPDAAVVLVMSKLRIQPFARAEQTCKHVREYASFRNTTKPDHEARVWVPF